jgi:hypothetical protein
MTDYSQIIKDIRLEDGVDEAIKSVPWQLDMPLPPSHPTAELAYKCLLLDTKIIGDDIRSAAHDCLLSYFTRYNNA